MQDQCYRQPNGGYSPSEPSHPGYQSVFDINYGAKIRDITDGTSNTLIMVEYLTGTPQDSRGWFWTNQAGGQIIFAWSTPNSSSPDRSSGCDTFYGNTNLPEMNLPCVSHPGNLFVRTATSRSRHSGGVNVALCDGSVHFIDEGIDVLIWRAMGTIDGGEIAQVQ